MLLQNPLLKLLPDNSIKLHTIEEEIIILNTKYDFFMNSLHQSIDICFQQLLHEIGSYFQQIYFSIKELKLDIKKEYIDKAYQFGSINFQLIDKLCLTDIIFFEKIKLNRTNKYLIQFPFNFEEMNLNLRFHKENNFNVFLISSSVSNKYIKSSLIHYINIYNEFRNFNIPEKLFLKKKIGITGLSEIEVKKIERRLIRLKSFC